MDKQSIKDTGIAHHLPQCCAPAVEPQTCSMACVPADDLALELELRLFARSAGSCGAAGGRRATGAGGPGGGGRGAARQRRRGCCNGPPTGNNSGRHSLAKTQRRESFQTSLLTRGQLVGSHTDTALLPARLPHTCFGTRDDCAMRRRRRAEPRARQQSCRRRRLRTPQDLRPWTRIWRRERRLSPPLRLARPRCQLALKGTSPSRWDARCRNCTSSL